MEALRIPIAIYENYGGNPTQPLKVAKALDLLPNSSHFRTIAGAAVAYGVTDGGANAPQITITPLGLRIVQPTIEDDDLVAKREAFLKPQVIGEFLRKYNDTPFPRSDIAQNVLIEMGVPKDRVQEIFDLVIEEAERLGFFTEIKGKRYVTFSSIPTQNYQSKELSESISTETSIKGVTEQIDINKLSSKGEQKEKIDASKLEKIKRVFITHGKNHEFIEPIKKLLTFGEFQAVVATENESVAKPVPDKVMDNMRSCGAAIIHVDTERLLKDEENKPYDVLNPNVLIEIGAAMALYGRRFILLVRQGVILPSNLQGLYEVRYNGDSLDGNSTVRLLEAIMDIKNHPIP